LSDENELRYQVAVANRVLAKTGLCSGATLSAGHASMRDPGAPDRFAVKGRGYEIDAPAAVTPEQMVVCDLDGQKVAGAEQYTQCFEVKLHSCIYREHPHIGAVVHAHPRFTTLMSVLDADIRPVCKWSASLFDGSLPVYPHAANVITDQQGSELAALLGDAQAVVLRAHGAVTVGAGLPEAVTAMVNLEEHARMNWYAYCAAGPGYPALDERQLADVRTYNDARLIEQLDHMNGPAATAGGLPAVMGVWQYYATLAAQDLEAGRLSVPDVEWAQ